MPSALTAVFMACGHITREQLESGQPVCVSCLGLDPRALVVLTRPAAVDPRGRPAPAPAR